MKMKLRIYLIVITLFWLKLPKSETYRREVKKKLESVKYLSWLNSPKDNFRHELTKYWWKETLPPTNHGYFFIKKLNKPRKFSIKSLIKSSKHPIFSKSSYTSTNSNSLQTIHQKKQNFFSLKSYNSKSHNASFQQLLPYSFASSLHFFSPNSYQILSKLKPNFVQLPSSNLFMNDNKQSFWHVPISKDNHKFEHKLANKLDKIKVKPKDNKMILKKEASKKILKKNSHKNSRKIKNAKNEKFLASSSSSINSVIKNATDYHKFEQESNVHNYKYSKGYPYSNSVNVFEDKARPHLQGWIPKKKTSWFPGTYRSAFFAPDTRIIKFTIDDIIKSEKEDSLKVNSTKNEHLEKIDNLSDKNLNHTEDLDVKQKKNIEVKNLQKSDH